MGSSAAHPNPHTPEEKSVHWHMWIHACTRAQVGSKAVAKKASLLDGELFFMKQLLILREQIAPFDAEFRVTEKDLDFTHMRDYLRRILAGAAAAAESGVIADSDCDCQDIKPGSSHRGNRLRHILAARLPAAPISCSVRILAWLGCEVCGPTLAGKASRQVCICGFVAVMCTVQISAARDCY